MRCCCNRTIIIARLPSGQPVSPSRVHGCIHDVSHAGTLYSFKQLLTGHCLVGAAADCKLEAHLVVLHVQTLVPELPHLWVTQLIIALKPGYRCCVRVCAGEGEGRLRRGQDLNASVSFLQGLNLQLILSSRTAQEPAYMLLKLCKLAARRHRVWRRTYPSHCIDPANKNRLLLASKTKAVAGYSHPKECWPAPGGPTPKERWIGAACFCQTKVQKEHSCRKLNGLKEHIHMIPNRTA